MNSTLSLLGSQFEELLSNLVKEAVAEALREQKSQESPRYPEKVGVAQAAEITGLSKNSLYQMHSKGKVPGAMKFGGKLLFDTAELRKWRDNGGRAA